MGFSTSKRRKHSKVGDTTLRAYHFRIETNTVQSATLHKIKFLTGALRNDLTTVLDTDRKDNRALKQNNLPTKYISAFDLKRQVASAKLSPKYRVLHSQVRQNISQRVSEGTENWFKALASGQQNIKPPKPIPVKRFRSFTYPQYGASANIKNNRLHLAKLGDFKVLGWRPMRGKKKSITVKWKDGHWWAIVLCEVQEKDVCQRYHQVVAAGLTDGSADPGISVVLTDSLGRCYATPKPLKAATAKLRHIQKDVSRKYKAREKAHAKLLSETMQATGSSSPVADGLVPSLKEMPKSNRLKNNIAKLGRAHTKVANIRDDAAKGIKSTLACMW